MIRTRRNNQGQPSIRESKAGNQIERSRKKPVGLGWVRGQGAEGTGLETIAEQLEMLSKIDWSRYRSG